MRSQQLTTDIPAPAAEQKPKTVTLYYKKGTSDKVYHIHLVEAPPGWKVNVGWHRRGDTPKTQTKTQQPVSYEEANSIYNQILRKQTKEGYTQGETGTPFQDTPYEERNSGIFPQLLNPLVNDQELQALLLNNDYACQEKFDGERRLIRGSTSQIEGINRTGLVVALPQLIADGVKGIFSAGHQDVLLDGELLGHSFVVFDLLQLDGKDLRQHPYRERLSLLQTIAAHFTSQITLIHTVTGPAKFSFLNSLRDTQKEGVVFKNLHAPYSPDRPASGGSQRKQKFCETASFLITGINNKRSVSISLFNQEGNLLPAGNVTIPANCAIPEINQVVEVKYLYAYRQSGIIFQPVYQRLRNDIKPEECRITQLKYKADPVN